MRLDLIARGSDRVRDFHDLDVDVEVYLRRSIVQRQNPIHALHPCDQRQERRLAPDRDLTRKLRQRRQESGKLNRIAKPMIATNKDMPAAQGLAAPNPLKMTRTFMLSGSGAANSQQVAVGDLPCLCKVGCADRGDPVMRSARLMNGDHHRAASSSVGRTPGKFVEAAYLSVLGPILIQERKIGFVELLKELVPTDIVEALVFRPEIDTQDPCMTVFFRSRHCCGPSATLGRPIPDDLVIRGRVTFAHYILRAVSYALQRDIVHFVLVMNLVPQPALRTASSSSSSSS
jgi:hypothetical protein